MWQLVIKFLDHIGICLCEFVTDMHVFAFRL